MTGVQTCALPISVTASSRFSLIFAIVGDDSAGDRSQVMWLAILVFLVTKRWPHSNLSRLALFCCILLHAEQLQYQSAGTCRFLRNF